MTDFSPGDLIEEIRDDKLVAKYIIIDKHYLEGCNLNQILGYSAIVIYSPNELDWYKFKPGSHWFIRLSDIRNSSARFNVIVSSKLRWHKSEKN